MAIVHAGQQAGKRFLIVIVSALFLVGIGTLVLANNVTRHDFAMHLLRDFGIACLISALVTVLYEAYVRYRFDIAKIDTLLNTVYGSSIPLNVWENIRDTLLSRTVLREDAAFHLRVRPHPKSEAMVILEVQIEYSLRKLRKSEYNITHYLDAHIADEALGLPRFLHASVGSDSFALDRALSEKSNASVDESGCLTLKIGAQKDAPTEIPVAIRRLEVRSVPGSYFFVMTEVTPGLRVYLEECPETVAVKLASWPIEPEIDLTAQRYALLSQIFLPGHSIEFKFLRAAKNQAEPGATSK